MMDSDQGMGCNFFFSAKKKSKRQELHEIEQAGHEAQSDHLQGAVHDAQEYRCENSRARQPAKKQHEVCTIQTISITM